MTGALRLILLVCALFLGPQAALAGLTVQVDLSSQIMTVTEGDQLRHRWAISSGREGYRTPNGIYRPQRLERMHYSSKYNWSPMPHSIFFRGGYAIHGTGEVRRLGRTASHGCIRLAPGHAAQLFRLVQAHGAGATRIVVTGNAALADAPRRARPTYASAPAPRPLRERPRRMRVFEGLSAPAGVRAPSGYYAPAPYYYYAPGYVIVP